MINILLDLDQTCISAESLDGDRPEFDFRNKEQAEKAKLFNYKNMDDYYMVFERPGLQDFLDFLFKNFNVSVWTAASKDYALFIIDKIILGGRPERKLDWIFFSYHCKLSECKTDNSKDLSLLSRLYKFPNYNLDNTLILDDTPTEENNELVSSSESNLLSTDESEEASLVLDEENTSETQDLVSEEPTETDGLSPEALEGDLDLSDLTNDTEEEAKSEDTETTALDNDSSFDLGDL